MSPAGFVIIIVDNIVAIGLPKVSGAIGKGHEGFIRSVNPQAIGVECDR